MESNVELKKSMSQNGGEAQVVQEVKENKKQQLGGFKALPFILATEMCDRFGASGFHANLITYLTEVLNLPLVRASNTLTNFDGTASFTPIIGAFVADSFAGRFSTIILGSVIYVMGMITITVSSALPQLRPPPCPTKVNCQEASSLQLWILYIALFLTSLGIGGIRPCVYPFAADQFDMSKAKRESRSWNLFNWFYFCLGFASLLALTIVVYIQDNVSWSWGLGIPTIAMGLSLVAFVLGSPLYNKIKSEGSPFVRVAQVIVSALRKRNVVVPDNPGVLYENQELDVAISTSGRLLHSDQFKWFDRAATMTDTDILLSNKPNLWRLATVHRVEELKTIIRMIPIWVAVVPYIAAQSHLNSFSIQQARTMDRHLSPSFQIPPASMAIFRVLTVLICLPLYERAFVPLTRKLTKNPLGITCLQRVGIGFVINMLATAVSALIETKRKQVAADYNLLDRITAIVPISVFWLVPQNVLHGLAEVFMNVGMMEFLYDQSPESMRSTAVALYWVAIAMGNYLSTFMVTLIHKYSGNKRNWLPDRGLNKGRLDDYYWLVTGIQIINLVYYVISALYYKYKLIEESKIESLGEDAEYGDNCSIPAVNDRAVTLDSCMPSLRMKTFSPDKHTLQAHLRNKRKASSAMVKSNSNLV